MKHIQYLWFVLNLPIWHIHTRALLLTSLMLLVVTLDLVHSMHNTANINSVAGLAFKLATYYTVSAMHGEFCTIVLHVHTAIIIYAMCIFTRTRPDLTIQNFVLTIAL